VLDIGFGELIVIGVVALVVIGPERLPRVARTAGHLLGRFQRYVSDVKADINREIELSELKGIKSSVEDAARSIENTVKTEMEQAGKEIRGVEDELNKTGDALKQAEDEIRSAVALPNPHMGMGGSAWPVDPSTPQPDPALHAGDSEPTALENTPLTAPQQVSQVQGMPDVAESSPQLELGLEAGSQPGESAAQRPA
jgi:sec-independent protein translocase protein TatB